MVVQETGVIIRAESWVVNTIATHRGCILQFSASVWNDSKELGLTHRCLAHFPCSRRAHPCLSVLHGWLVLF